MTEQDPTAPQSKEAQIDPHLQALHTRIREALETEALKSLTPIRFIPESIMEGTEVLLYLDDWHHTRVYGDGQRQIELYFVQDGTLRVLDALGIVYEKYILTEHGPHLASCIPGMSTPSEVVRLDLAEAGIYEPNGSLYWIL